MRCFTHVPEFGWHRRSTPAPSARARRTWTNQRDAATGEDRKVRSFPPPTTITILSCARALSPPPPPPRGEIESNSGVGSVLSRSPPHRRPPRGAGACVPSVGEEEVAPALLRALLPATLRHAGAPPRGDGWVSAAQRHFRGCPLIAPSPTATRQRGESGVGRGERGDSAQERVGPTTPPHPRRRPRERRRGCAVLTHPPPPDHRSAHSAGAEGAYGTSATAHPPPTTAPAVTSLMLATILATMSVMTADSRRWSSAAAKHFQSRSRGFAN